MKKEEYFLALGEYNWCYLSIIDSFSSKLHLISPIKKKSSMTFTLVVNGSFFARLDSLDGVLWNEFINLIRIKNKNNPIKLEDFSMYIGEAIDKAIEIYGAEEVDRVTKSSLLSEMLQEIKRIVNHNKLKGIFSSFMPYVYSRQHLRPYKVCLLETDVSSRVSMLEVLDVLEKKGIFEIQYSESFVLQNELKNYLKYKESFYSILEIEKRFLSNKELVELKQLGLNEITLSLSSYKHEIEFMSSSRSLKEIASMIKACRNCGIKVSIRTTVTSLNSDYVSLVEYLHQLGVADFSVKLEDSVEEKDLVIKRAYYYTNINALKLNLESKVISKEQFRLMDINPRYEEYMRTTLFMKKDAVAYFDKECTALAGDIKKVSLRDCYLAKEVKKARKVYYKGLK